MDFHLPTTDKPDTTIVAGDYVRSYDFPGIRDDCYVEGSVARITEPMEGCARYEVHVDRCVLQGVDDEPSAPVVYPPVNGTPSWLGGVTYGVVKVQRH